MLEESVRMITDTNKRLDVAVQELRDLIVSSTSPSSLPSPCPHFILPRSSRHPSLQIQSKSNPALAEAQELLDAEEEIKAATLQT